MAKRRLHVLSLVSAVVCVGSLVLVGRSVFWGDMVVVPIGESRTCWISSMDGQLMLMHEPWPGSFRYISAPMAEVRPDLYGGLWPDLTGIRWLGIGWGNWGPYQWLVLPLWLAPIVTAVLPVRWWRLRRGGGGRGFAVIQRAGRTGADGEG